MNEIAKTEEFGLTSNRKSTSTRILILIAWLIYFPSAVYFLMLSGMASDSGSISIGLSIFVFLINFLPLVMMVYMTIKAYRKDSGILAITAPFISGAVSWTCMIAIGIGSVYFTKSPRADLTPRKNLFVCSENVYIEVVGDYPSLTRIEGKGFQRTNIGDMNGKNVDVMDFFSHNKDNMETLTDCKNVDDKSFSEVYRTF